LIIYSDDIILLNIATKKKHQNPGKVINIAKRAILSLTLYLTTIPKL